MFDNNTFKRDFEDSELWVACHFPIKLTHKKLHYDQLSLISTMIILLAILDFDTKSDTTQLIPNRNILPLKAKCLPQETYTLY